MVGEIKHYKKPAQVRTSFNKELAHPSAWSLESSSPAAEGLEGSMINPSKRRSCTLVDITWGILSCSRRVNEWWEEAMGRWDGRDTEGRKDLGKIKNESMTKAINHRVSRLDLGFATVLWPSSSLLITPTELWFSSCLWETEGNPHRINFENRQWTEKFQIW